MKVEGRVGAIAAAEGTINPLVTNSVGALVTAMQSGKYAEACAAGRVYSVANQAAVVATAALATTWTGLCIGNPASSGKNARILQVGMGLTVASSSMGVVGLMTGLSTTAIEADIVPQNALLGGAAGVVNCANAQTIGTPTINRVLGTYGTGATTVLTVGVGLWDIEGSLILTPGYFCAIYTFNIITTGPIFSFMWEEVDI